MNTSLFAILGPIIGAVIAFGIPILVYIVKTSSQTDSIATGINSLNNRFDGLFTALSLARQQASPETVKDFSESVKKLDEILKSLKLKEKQNPLSSYDIERFNNYRDKIAKRAPLDYEEYNDFRSLQETIRNELSKKKRSEFDIAMAGLIGFAAGIALTALITSLPKR